MRDNNFDKKNRKNITALLVIFTTLLLGCSTDKLSEPIETLPMNRVSVKNLEAFESTTQNWRIGGDIRSDRHVDHDLQAMDGTGILINTPSDENKDHLFTKWTHGDLELKLDFLMPKGSNSGIYFMGRYEVQLFDSWGVKKPKYSDAGGIYRRRNDSRPDGQEEFEGYAPKLNAARAPGLWQHLKVLFKAPEFNADGEKTSNAMFKEVWLNGVLIHENVEVSGPTIEAFFDDEQAEGPLMFQGDHGPVAIRNIEYKKYDKTGIQLNSLGYNYYAGEFDRIPDFGSLEADESGTVDSLAGNVIDGDDRYALKYTGTLQTPNSGDYLFNLQTAGMVRMLIDGKVIFYQNRPYRMHERVSALVYMESGEHEFTLEYINHPNNWYWGLALFAEGPQLRHQKIHASSSVPGGGRELPDLIVGTKDRVKIVRSFAMHRGTKRTHVVNVGAPNGINYNYDIGQSALLHAWEGPFLNTKEMWIHRGEPQVAEPWGPPISFAGKPTIAKLSNDKQSWPDSVSWNKLQVEGYSISDSGWPVFNYKLGDVRVHDHFEGSVEDRRLVRTIRFESTKIQEGLWVQLASGKNIIQNENEYIVDDRSYYLNLMDNGELEPKLVQHENKHDLRVPLLTNSTEAVIKYKMIW